MPFTHPSPHVCHRASDWSLVHDPVLFSFRCLLCSLVMSDIERDALVAFPDGGVTGGTPTEIDFVRLAKMIANLRNADRR